MKINNTNIGNAAQLYKAQQEAIEKSNKKVELGEEASKSKKTDEVILSKEAKELAKSSQSEREEKLARLKAEIQAGTYQPELEDIADSIIKHLFGAR